MSLSDLLSYNIKTLDVILRQEDECHFPYYGPVARGWLGSALSNNIHLYNEMFKDKNKDVRPFFMYSEVIGKRDISIKINFIGRKEREIEEIIKVLERKRESFLAGKRARIVRLRYNEKKFRMVKNSSRNRIDFKTPIKINYQKNSQLLPDFISILKSLIRSVNKFTKYHLPDAYPIRMENYTYDIRSRIINMDIRPLKIKHYRMDGPPLYMDGIKGHVEYETDYIDSEISKLFTLAQFFQVGRWVNYGFGKIEVIT